MRKPVSMFAVPLGVALAITGATRSSFAFSEAVEFDVTLQPAPTRQPLLPFPLDGWRLTRVKVFELIAGAHGDEPFYTEELGYVRFDDGRAHITLGGTSAETFRHAFKLDRSPDDSLFSHPLSIQLEACNRVHHGWGSAKDTCDDRPDSWTLQGREVPLNAVPLAMSVAQVPLFALPQEVVLQNELDTALAAERRANEAALAAIRAAAAAEQDRATQAEASLRSDVAALADAERRATDAEAAARQAADTSLAAQLAAEQATRAAQDARLESMIVDESLARQSGDQQAVETARGIAAEGDQRILSSLATPGAAVVSYANLVGVPGAGHLDIKQVVTTTFFQDQCVLGIGFGSSGIGGATCPDGYVMTGCTGSADGDGQLMGTSMFSDGVEVGKVCGTSAKVFCRGSHIETTAFCARVIL